MGFNRPGTSDHLIADPVEHEHLAVDFKPDPGMRIYHGGVSQIFNKPFFRGKCAFELNLDPRPMCPIPLYLAAGKDFRFIRINIDLNGKFMGRVFRAGPGNDEGWDPCSELGIQYCSADTDPLLPSALSYLVKPGPIQELAKDKGDLVRNDPRAIVFDNDPVDFPVLPAY